MVTLEDKRQLSADGATVLSAIRQRRSIRRYLDQPVTDEMIREIVEAGIWAPSAHNRQPWRFVIVRELPAKEALAVAMGKRLRADLEKDHVSEDVIARDLARSYERVTGAPVSIVLCLSMQDMDVYNDAVRDRNEHVMAIQSVAMAGQNMLLAAHAMGLGACWMCAPLFGAEAVIEALDLDPDWQPQGMITLGYSDQNRSKNRESTESRIVWR